VAKGGQRGFKKRKSGQTNTKGEGEEHLGRGVRGGADVEEKDRYFEPPERKKGGREVNKGEKRGAQSASA